MEYGLYEDRWWMLRYAALDAVGNMGSWLGVPLKFERVYTDYEVEGGTPPPAGSTFRPGGHGARRDRPRRRTTPSRRGPGGPPCGRPGGSASIQLTDKDAIDPA